MKPAAGRPTAVGNDLDETGRRGFLLASAAAFAVLAGCRRGPDSARLPPPRAAPDVARVAWEPQKTWAFFVGVLSFTDPSFASFPTEGRVDAEIVQALKDRGVPEEQIVFLVDEVATKSTIEAELATHLKKAAPGDMLILYYAGHGHREPDGATYFIPYDVEGDAITSTGWGITAMIETIARDFRGSTVLLSADCCYSGRLAVEAATQSSRLAFATLASAVEQEVSTDAWTFSECMRDALRGRPRLDRDRDGVITLDELGRWVEEEMPFKDGQLATFALGDGFPRGLALTQRVAADKPRVGEHVELHDGDEWKRATIEDAKNGKLRVHLLGAPAETDEWVEAARVRPWAPSQLAIGATVGVLDEGQWYDATILDAKLGVHFVHYAGWPTSDDEWIGPERVRVPGSIAGPLAVAPGQTERITR